MPDGSSHPYFYKGSGDLLFSDVSDQWGTGDKKGYFNGAAYADLDNDGNLDLVINCIGQKAVVLKNNAPPKNFLTLAFKGNNPNTSGIGCKAYLFDRQKMQYQQLMLTRGFQSASEARLHFGLDSITTIDSLLIVWPDQKQQLLTHLKTNQILVIDQKNASGHFDYADRFAYANELLTNVSATISNNWRHQENDFTDFNVQYLIPHEESTRGPKIAVADVNGDGLDDYYACGASGQAGALFVQQPDGKFARTDTTIFLADAVSEDVDAVFFDADGNGTPDLYVACGGNEVESSPILQDRLYLNDGKGHFTKAPGALPRLYKNKSTVMVADVDKDGDNDLFVGVLANANAYGLPQTSYLLINDGKGHFSVANNNRIPLENVGMVTSAVFADINHDGWTDLVVAGEWMPVTIFLNNKGTFQKTTLATSGGLWQTVFASDVNSDGNIDLLLGNWGWNNKFWSGKDGPLKMYVADFDKNGQTEQLLSYTTHGEEYPFLAKDEVERPLPLLKKHYLLYADYAGQVMKDVFYGWVDTVKPLLCDRLGSAVAWGNGKGNFSLQDLPAQLQLAPIFSFAKLPGKSANYYICGGNFYDVIPYEGRYDAQPLSIFSAAPARTITYLPQPSLFNLHEQVRDMKWLHTGAGERLMAAGNNSTLQWFQLNQ